MQIDADSFAHVRYQAVTEYRTETPTEKPSFDLDNLLKPNDLMKLTGSFDIMREAIAYLMNQQGSQSVLINELLECTRDLQNSHEQTAATAAEAHEAAKNMKPFVVEKSEDVELDKKSDKKSQPGDKSAREPAAALKTDSRKGSATSQISRTSGARLQVPQVVMPKLPDYSKLHADFDRRITELEKVDNTFEKEMLAMERQKHEIDQKISKLRGENEGERDRILKLENEIKMLKIALNAGNASGGGVDMDSLTQLMNMVNELSDKLKEDCEQKYVTLTRFDDHVSKNADEHKMFEQDNNHAAMRIKLLEEWRGSKDERDAKTEKQVGFIEKHVKKHTEQIDLLIYQLSQNKSGNTSFDPSAFANLGGGLSNADTSELEARIADLEDKIGKVGGGSNDSLTELLVARLEDLEAKQTKETAKLSDVAEQLSRLRKEFDNFDGQSLKKEVSKLNSHVLSLITRDEFKKIDSELSRLRSQLLDARDDAGALKERIIKNEDNIETQRAQTKEHFEGIHKQCDTLGLKITALERLITRLSEKIDNGVSQGLPANKNSLLPTKLSGNVEDNGDRITNLEQKLESFTQRCIKVQNDHQFQLDDKASKQDLIDLEQRLRDLIDELMKGGGGKGDDSGLKKKLTQLEKMMKRLYELMAELQAKQTEEEDAMFTKKYVGPVHCASCEKGIVNLEGKMADKVHWNRLPFREPGERIARYGKGFSQYLAQAAQQEQMLRTINDKRGSGFGHMMNMDSGGDLRGDYMHSTNPGAFPNGSPKPNYALQASSDMFEQTTNTESKNQQQQQEFHSAAMLDQHGSHPSMMVNVPTYHSNQPVQAQSSLPDVHARSPSKNRS